MKTSTKIALSLVAAVLVVAQNQACGRMASLESSSVSSSGVSDPAPVGLPEDQLSSIETVRVVHKNELMASIQSILDMPYADSVYTSFSSVAANLSDDGYVDSVTAPMMTSLLTVNGTACDSRVRAEKLLAATDRKLFKSIDFKKAPTAQAATAYTDLIRALSRRAWLRNETDDERAAILDAAKVFDTAVVSDTDKKALFICAAMLTSLDAITR